MNQFRSLFALTLLLRLCVLAAVASSRSKPHTQPRGYGGQVMRASLLAEETRSNAGARIINGTLVGKASKEFPYFAMPTSDATGDSWLGCGASIVSPTWGMTAAHCFGGGDAPCSGPHRVGLWLGDLELTADGEIQGKPGGRHLRIEAKVVCHSLFDGKCSHGHDIVLLELDLGSHTALPDWVVPVPLNMDAVPHDIMTKSLGFGVTEDVADPTEISTANTKNLHQVGGLKVFTDDFEPCASVYAGGFGCSDPASEGAATNKGQQLCAGAVDEPERDTCSGDSGSPLLNEQGQQIGIVSYGGGPGDQLSGPAKMCASPKYLGVYTRISAFKEFITKHIKDLPTF